MQADTAPLSAIVHNMGYVVDHPDILSEPQLSLFREYIQDLARSSNYAEVHLPKAPKIVHLGTFATAADISLYYKVEGSKEMVKMYALFWRGQLLTLVPHFVAGWDKYRNAFSHALTLWRMCSADEVREVCEAVSAWAK